MSDAFRRYAELLDRLFWLRALGSVSDDDEERYAEALNECRTGMTAGEEDQIDALIARKRAVPSRQALGLKDTTPQKTAFGPPREEAQP